MNHDEAIRQLDATQEHLRNARGGMRLIRDEEEVRAAKANAPLSEVHDMMQNAIGSATFAISEVGKALEILRAAVRAEA